MRIGIENQEENKFRWLAQETKEWVSNYRAKKGADTGTLLRRSYDRKADSAERNCLLHKGTES